MFVKKSHESQGHVSSLPLNHSLPAYLPFKGPFTRWPLASEIVMVVLVFWASVFIPSDNKHHDQQIVLRALEDVPVFMLVLLAISAVSLFWRKSQPLGVVGVILLIMAGSTALGYSYDFFGVPIALYSVGRYEKNERLSIAGGFAIGLISFILLFDDSESLSGIGFAFAFLFIVWYLGRRVRARGEYLFLLKDRAEQLEREKEYQAEVAVASERARIARELHDIVAHKVSLMTVQSAAAKVVISSAPEKAAEAISHVEEAGRQALSELRQLLSVLRPEESSHALTPQPSVDQIASLIDGFRQAGLKLEYRTKNFDIDVATIPSALSLTIYRVFQEGLTNVLKHAGSTAPTFASLEYKEGHIIVLIKNDRPLVDESIQNAAVNEANHVDQKSGYGLIGMRERVSMLEGDLHAEKEDSGGFKLLCRIPFVPNRIN